MGLSQPFLTTNPTPPPGQRGCDPPILCRALAVPPLRTDGRLSLPPPPPYPAPRRGRRSRRRRGLLAHATRRRRRARAPPLHHVRRAHGVLIGRLLLRTGHLGRQRGRVRASRPLWRPGTDVRELFAGLEAGRATPSFSRRPFISITHSMWWAIVAITTIGYGDLIPTTACGRTVASVLLICDIVLLALPSELLTSLGRPTQPQCQLCPLAQSPSSVPPLGSRWQGSVPRRLVARPRPLQDSAFSVKPGAFACGRVLGAVALPE